MKLNDRAVLFPHVHYFTKSDSTVTGRGMVVSHDIPAKFCGLNNGHPWHGSHRQPDDRGQDIAAHSDRGSKKEAFPGNAVILLKYGVHSIVQELHDITHRAMRKRF